MPTGSPIFELLVSIKSDGLDKLDKQLAAEEKKLQALEKKWNDFGKNSKKGVDDLGKSLDGLNKKLDKFDKDQAKRNKTWLDNWGKLNKSVDDFGKKLDDLNKKKVNVRVDADTKVAQAKLDAIDRKAREIDAKWGHSVRINVEAEVEEALRRMGRVGAKATELDGSDPRINVIADVIKALQEMDRAIKKGEDVSHLRPEIQVLANVARALEEMDRAEKKGEDLATLRPTIQVLVDSLKAMEDMDHTEERAVQIGKLRETVTILADKAGFDVTADQVEERVARIKGLRATITVDANDTDWEEKFYKDLAQKAELGVDAVNITIKGNDTDWLKKAIDVEAMKAILGTDVDIRINVHGAEEATAEMGTLAAAAGVADAAMEKLGADMHLTWGGLIVLIGAATAAVTPLLGGLAALGGAVSALAAGVGVLMPSIFQLAQGFGKVEAASQNLKNEQQKLRSAQEELTAAQQDGDPTWIAEAQKNVATETRNVYKQQALLNVIYDEASTGVQHLFDSWTNLKASFADVTGFKTASETLADIAAKALDLTSQALPALGNIAVRVADAAQNAFSHFFDELQRSDEIQNFEAILEGADNAVEDIVTALGDFLLALANVFAIAIPQGLTLTGIIRDLAAQFLAWTQSAEGIQEIKDAIAGAAVVFDALWQAVLKVSGAILQLGMNHMQGVAQFFTILGDLLWAAVKAFDGLFTVIGAIGPVLSGLIAIGVVAAMQGWELSVASFVTKLWTIAAAVPEIMAALAPLIALSIVIDVILYWDQAAADTAYQQAVDSGESTGNAYADSIVAGLKSVPIVGPLISWVDENIAKPLRNWVDEHSSEDGKTWATTFLNNVQTGLSGQGDPVGDWLAAQIVKINAWGAADPFGSAISTAMAKTKAKLDSEDPIGPWLTKEGKKIDEWGNKDPVGTSLGDSFAKTKEKLDSEDPIGPWLQEKWKDFDNFAKRLQPIWDGIKQDAADFSSWVQEKWQELQDYLQSWVDWFDTNISQPIQDDYQAISDWVNEKWTEAQGYWQTLQDYIDSWLQWFQDTIIQPIEDAYQEAADWVNEKWTEAQGYWQDLQDFIDGWLQWFQDNIVQPLKDAYQQISDWINQKIEEIKGYWNDFKGFLSDWVGIFVSTFVQPVIDKVNSIGTAISNMVATAKTQLLDLATSIANVMSKIPFLSNTAAGIKAAVGGSDRGAPSGGTGTMAKGGIEAQPSTGGVSNGTDARIVFGEQQQNVKEAYIVEDRPDNLPYLAEAASWFGMGLTPVDGMARGGVKRRHRGKRGGGGSLNSQLGKRFSQVPHYKPPKQKSTSTGGSTSTSTKGTTGTSPTGSTGSGAGGSGGGITKSSTPDVQMSGATTDSGTGVPTAGDQSQCGAFPSSTPVDSSQQPFTDAALGQFGMAPVQASPDTGFDHVNIPQDTQAGGDLCGTANGSGSVPAVGSDPMTSTTPSGTSPSSPSSMPACGPSGSGGTTSQNNVVNNQSQTLTMKQNSGKGKITGFAKGGIAGGTSPSSTAGPVMWTAVPIGWWNSFLDKSWVGNPTEDWATLFPPSGWDPWSVYTPGTPSQGLQGQARGGILRNGIRYFQGGGLNASQIQAGIDAGNSALGAPYSYGSAGEDGGYDCAGIWNYIESAVLNGTPSTGKRWGTGEADSGATSFSTPGLTPEGANIGVTLSGAGGPDDTHMAGDIGGVTFESDAFDGVSNGAFMGAAANFPDQWTMGGAADFAAALPTNAPSTTAPSQNMADMVGGAWNCTPTGSQFPATGSPPAVATPTSGSLPGMSQDALQGLGQQQIGTLGDPSIGTPPSTGSGGTQPAAGQFAPGDGPAQSGQGSCSDWIIAGMEAAGLDPVQSDIDTLMGLVQQESGCDPTAVNSDSGATGLFQLMPDTWDAWNLGGDIMDPVANATAGIRYMINRYGGIIGFSPYAEGGYATGPMLGMVGEQGREFYAPLDNQKLRPDLQAAVGTAGLRDELRAMSDKLEAALDRQSKLMPARTGDAVAGGMRTRLVNDQRMRQSVSKAQDREAMRTLFAGVKH